MTRSWNNYLIYDSVSDDQREYLHRILDLGLSFFDTANKKTFQYADIESIVQKLNEYDPQTYFKDPEDIYDFLDYFVKHSAPQCKKKYLAFPDSGNSLASIVGDIIKSCTNQNLIAVDRSAPVATMMEIQLILWLRELIGYPHKKLSELTGLCDIGGMWTPGGNMSNYIAILTALRKKYPTIVKNGLRSLPKQPVILVAKDIAHYSIENAAQQLGLGRDSIVWVDTDSNYNTDVESMERAIACLHVDQDPFIIIAVAGNCRTSGVDNISALCKLAQKHGIWCHIDACHGGSLLFSEKHRAILGCIESADSVTLDPHKSLFTTYSSSYVLFKNSFDLGSFCRYPEKFCNPQCLDLGLITPFLGSRGFESIKLWLLLNLMGIKGVGELVNARIELANRIITKISSLDNIVSLNQSYIYRFAFVCIPNNIHLYPDSASQVSQINLFNEQLSDMIYRRGNIILDCFKLKDVSNKLGYGRDTTFSTLGLSFGHVEYTKAELQELINELEQCIHELLLKSNCTSRSPQFTSSPADWS